jgi:serine/threonine-protein kinase RsbW
MRLTVAVSLPRDSSTVGVVRDVVASALQSFGVTPDCVHDIRLALSEACTNVIEHAAFDDEYEVRLDVGDRLCSVTVTDTGTGLDAHELEGVLPDDTSPGGRGVAIMRAVMDHVEFTSEPETGSVVHLVKGLTFNQGAPVAGA